MSSNFDLKSAGTENVTDLLDVRFKATTPPALCTGKIHIILK